MSGRAGIADCDPAGLRVSVVSGEKAPTAVDSVSEIDNI